MLTDVHKKNLEDAAQAFLARYEDQGDDFLDCIVKGDQTWVSHVFLIEGKSGWKDSFK
jgi:hypothetical protein